MFVYTMEDLMRLNMLGLIFILCLIYLIVTFIKFTIEKIKKDK